MTTSSPSISPPPPAPSTPRRALSWNPLRLLATPVDPEAATRRSARLPATAREWLLFGVVAVQLFLCAVVIDRFQIENRAFSTVFSLAAIGALVNALLPLRYRQAFLVTLSFATIALILKPVGGAWVITVGTVFLALCHAPVPAKGRVALVAAAALGLAAMRADWLSAPFSSGIWPVIGSLLMFRVVIYLYDVTHRVKPRSVWESLSYFFLLPNICFPLFPVVDYATYRKRYYAEDAWQCSQTGLRWIVRGVVQLLVYRFVYYYGVIAPEEVHGAGDVLRYVVTTFALYLRVSGLFHLAIGILRLYGFGLPETHFLYFLSSSVNDFWRRANIYWKDFMQKVFYLPMFFRLRRGGEQRAFVLSTVFVVMATWCLHSYQWFWLRGTFPVRWQDGMFWGVIGLMMVFNTLLERKSTKARGRRVAARDVRGSLLRCGQVVVTFVFISVLWSLWTCDSGALWLSMWGTIGGDAAPTTPAPQALGIAGVVIVVLVGGSLLGSRLTDRGMAGTGNRAFLHEAAITGGGLLLLLALSLQPVYHALGDAASEVVQSMRVARLNRLDAQKLQRGYYEDLLDVESFNSELWLAFKSKPRDWVELDTTSAMKPVRNFLLTELKPNQDIQYHGAPLRTNRYGMRDRDYTLEKPADTWRAALIGASYVMGSGVKGDQTFENVIEDRLNADPPVAGRHYQILNFSVGGYSPLQRVWMLEHRGIRFDPDAAIYVAHENEDYRIERHLVVARDRGVRPPWPEIEQIYREAGIDPDMPNDAFEKALHPYARRLIGLAYRRMAEVCREHGIEPVWVFLPTLEMVGKREDMQWLVDLAKDAGLHVIELFGVWSGHDIFAIRVAEWDYHPNAIGHRLVADRLLHELLKRPALLEPR